MAKFPKNYDPKGIGEKSEAMIMAAFLRADKTVLQPFGDNQRYDLVIDEEGEFFRIQCKTALLSKDKKYFEYPTSSQNWNSKKRKNYIGQADLFAVYLREEDEIFIFSVAKSPKGHAIARLAPSKAKGGQRKKIRMAKDYKFDPNRSFKECL